MKAITTCIYLLLCCAGFGQKVVRGKVRDMDNGKPVPFASIFLSNTSTGTRAADDGAFELGLPAGKFDLVVSSIGYATFTRTIDVATLADTMTILLKPRSDEMETVVITPAEKDGWEKWGRFFLDNFIGQSANASGCKLKNPEVLLFRHSRKDDQLTVDATGQLLVENRSLGYIIHYQMESFSYDFNSKYLIYTGYPFFEPMKGSEHQQKKWQQRRLAAFEGSMMHFMRSVYRNKIMEEGFEVRSIVKLPNQERNRVKEVYAARRKASLQKNGTVKLPPLDRDSAEYYGRIMAQDEAKDIFGKNILPGDSIAYAVNETTAGLDFNNYLLVIYTKKPAPLEYRQQFPKSSTAIMSQITLLNNRYVEVLSNGSYYDPADLLTRGYWSWSEKMANMLPFDYIPEKK